MNRREFLKVAIATPVALVAGCKISEILPEPDIILDGVDDATKIKKIYSEIETMVKNPGAIIRIGLMDESGDIRVLDLFRRQDSNSIAIFDEETNNEVALSFGWSGLSPTIVFEYKDGNMIEYPFFTLGLAPSRAAATDWLMLGIKIAAVGLAVFIGAKIAGLILAAIAFIAYYAMILALVVVGIALLSRGAKWLLDAASWDLEGVADFFHKKVEEIRELLNGVAADW